MSLAYLSASEIGKFDVLAAIDALEAALVAGVEPDGDPPRSVLVAGDGHLLVMPSVVTGRAVVKLVAVGGDPRVQGVCIVFDRETLAPNVVLDGAALTTLRTSAVSALAVRALAIPHARRLVVIGRGPQGHAHARAIRRVRAIEHVAMLGRGDERVDEHVAEADIICCCTTARDPLFDGTLVPDHAVVVAIGSHEPDARETDDALAQRATVVVESRRSALREAGDVIGAIDAGVLAANDLIALGDVVRGTVTPRSTAPTLFKSTGMAWEDAVVAGLLTVHAPRRAAARRSSLALEDRIIP